MLEIRKIITSRETIFAELGVKANRPTTRAVGMAVIRNPFAGQFVEDLRPLFEAGAMLGERLMPNFCEFARRTRGLLWQGCDRRHRWRDGARRCLCPSNARQTDADSNRRRQGGDRIECEGGRCGCSARRAARAQGRFLVLPAFRHNHSLGRRCASTGRDPGHHGHC